MLAKWILQRDFSSPKRYFLVFNNYFLLKETFAVWSFYNNIISNLIHAFLISTVHYKQTVLFLNKWVPVLLLLYSCNIFADLSLLHYSSQNFQMQKIPILLHMYVENIFMLCHILPHRQTPRIWGVSRGMTSSSPPLPGHVWHSRFCSHDEN